MAIRAFNTPSCPSARVRAVGGNDLLTQSVKEALEMKRWLGFVGLALVASILSSGLVAAADATPPAGTPAQPVFDPTRFIEVVDNPYFPLQPGTVFIYDGTSDGEAQRDEMTITDQTKMILGVRCIVVRDTVTVEGELIEDTLDWYAQDQDGNVWYLGEDSKSYEHGEVVSTEGSWEAGVDGAQAGIIMPADPQIGVEYRQEYYAGEAEDMASVLSIGDSVTVPYGTFENVLVTKEWSPLEPEVVEHKSYAPGIGLILEESVSGEQERLELIEVRSVAQATPIASPEAQTRRIVAKDGWTRSYHC